MTGRQLLKTDFSPSLRLGRPPSSVGNTPPGQCNFPLFSALGCTLFPCYLSPRRQPSFSLYLCLSSCSVPFTSSLNDTTPGLALVSLLGTLPGAMIAGTLSLQGTTSWSWLAKHNIAILLRSKTALHGRIYIIYRTCAGCTTRWALSRSPNDYGHSLLRADTDYTVNHC